MGTAAAPIGEMTGETIGETGETTAGTVAADPSRRSRTLGTRARPTTIESGIYMSDGSFTTEDAKSAGMSPLRLRVGVFLILLWIVPFWALAPYIANSLSGLSNPPSVAAVTTTIVVVQTILGLLGSWVAGTEVKSIIKGSTKRHALGAIWSILLHGEIRGQGEVGKDPNEGRPPRDDV
jgi:hypothetical protein